MAAKVTSIRVRWQPAAKPAPAPAPARPAPDRVAVEWTREVRYAVEKVCDRHGVAYHPSRGLGAGQAFLEDLLDALVQVPLGAVQEATREALVEVPTPVHEHLMEALVEVLKDHGTAVWSGNSRDATSSKTVVANVQVLFENGDPPSSCPNCGGDGEVVDRGQLRDTPHAARVICTEECGMPPTLWGVWEGLPRNNTVAWSALDDAVRALLQGWSWDLYENDVDTIVSEVVKHMVHALEAQHQ